MDDWRKKGDRSCNRRTKSYYHYRKPPPPPQPPHGGNPNWQQNVPSWEKRFVTSVGSMQWKKFLEAKEFIHLYDNILKWDDSAGEEAFKTAKNEFYKKLHGLSSDVDLHNPDLYIDQIDWNGGQVDHNLILDLESDPVVHDINNNHEPVVIFGDAIPDPYKDCSPYGWGDGDDEKMKKAWGVGDDLKRGDDNEINWDDYINDDGINWDDWNVGGDDNWCFWNENDNRAKDQGWNTDDDNNYYPSNGNVNNERHMKTVRFNGTNDRRNRSWRNNRNWRNSTGHGHGSQRGLKSTIQPHGGRYVQVYP